MSENSMTELGINCIHCGQELLGEWDYEHKHVVDGARPMKFLHADGSRTCVIRRVYRGSGRTCTAEPYSIWVANKALEQRTR